MRGMGLNKRDLTKRRSAARKATPKKTKVTRVAKSATTTAPTKAPATTVRKARVLASSALPPPPHPRD